MRMVRRLLLAFVVVLVVVPTADAATFGLTSERRCEREGCVDDRVATFAAAPGEANDLTVRGEGAEVVIGDRGAPLAPGTGCRALAAAEVACPADVARVDVGTGDGDDVVAVTLVRPEARVELGAGDDRLTGSTRADGGPGDDELRAAGASASFSGSDGDDVLVGGGASDGLNGGAGVDAMVGAGGDDTLAPGDLVVGPAGRVVDGPPASDLVDGGPGRDTLSYEFRRAGTVVDLALGTAGTVGEADRFTGIEDAAGGDGDDVLRGDAGPNRLDGVAGSDVLDGRAGDDVVTSGTAIDVHATLLGGPGDDELVAYGAARLLDGGPGDDVLRAPILPAREICGPGDDLLTGAEVPSLLRPEGCERLDAGVVVLRRPARRRDGRLALGVLCRQEPTRGGCRTTVAVMDTAGRTTSRARTTLARGRSRTLAVRLAPKLRTGALRVTVVVGSTTRAGRTRVRFALR